MKSLILLFSLIFIEGCIVPPAPRMDYYKLSTNGSPTFYDGVDYIYKNGDSILNLWVFSTPWKSVYLSTNLTTQDSIQVLKNNIGIIYLKKLDQEMIQKLPYHLYHNDSVRVYGKTLKIADKNWYKRGNRSYADTLNVQIDNKNYQFYLVCCPPKNTTESKVKKE